MQLTTHQARVMGLVTKGATNKQIAQELGRCETAVERTLTRIFVRLGVRNRTQAAIKWMALGRDI